MRTYHNSQKTIIKKKEMDRGGGDDQQNQPAKGGILRKSKQIKKATIHKRGGDQK